MIIIPLNDDFNPVLLKLATKAKVLQDPEHPGPYFIEIKPGYVPPADATVLEPDEKEGE